MTVLFRCRVEKPLLDQVDQVTKQLGTSTPEMFRVFLAQIARTGQIPVSLQVELGGSPAGPWPDRAAVIESFYDKSKAW